MPSGDEVFSLVIFGASGDLTNRKLLPALWSLYSARTLPEPFAIIGTARSEMTDEAFRAKMKDGVKQFARLKVPSDNVWDRFAASLYYVAGDPSSPDLYAKLRQRLESIESKHGDAGNRLYYLSTPPSLYAPITTQLGKAGLAEEQRGWTRIIIEKPFGHDLASAQELNELVTRSSTRSRSIASTTTSAKRPSRTSWSSASPTGSSSRCGTATTWTRSSSRWRKPSASRGAAGTTRSRARCAT